MKSMVGNILDRLSTLIIAAAVFSFGLWSSHLLTTATARPTPVEVACNITTLAPLTLLQE